MKMPKIERDAQRYAVTVREIAGGAFLVVWGLGMHESVEGLYAILWGSLGLDMALMIFIWHRERKNK